MNQLNYWWQAALIKLNKLSKIFFSNHDGELSYGQSEINWNNQLANLIKIVDEELIRSITPNL
jgi:hypothetical protein